MEGITIYKYDFENCAFTTCVSKINITQIDNAKDINVVRPVYKLIEYSNNYLKISWSLWHYCRDETVLTDAGTLDNSPGNSASFKFKQKITGSTGTNAIQIMVALKYLSNFWRTLEMPLMNCEINLIFLTWSANYVANNKSNAANNKATTFAIVDGKLYVSVVTLSTQYYEKLLQQLK